MEDPGTKKKQSAVNQQIDFVPGAGVECRTPSDFTEGSAAVVDMTARGCATEVTGGRPPAQKNNLLVHSRLTLYPEPGSNRHDIAVIGV